MEPLCLVTILKWPQNPKITNKKNLVLLVCHNKNQLSSEIKCPSIPQIEILLPGEANYMGYLKYLDEWYKCIQENENGLPDKK